MGLDNLLECFERQLKLLRLEISAGQVQLQLGKAAVDEQMTVVLDWFYLTANY